MLSWETEGGGHEHVRNGETVPRSSGHRVSGDGRLFGNAFSIERAATFATSLEIVSWTLPSPREIEFVLLSEAYHLAMIENPKMVAAEIGSFVDSTVNAIFSAVRE